MPIFVYACVCVFRLLPLGIRRFYFVCCVCVFGVLFTLLIVFLHNYFSFFDRKSSVCFFSLRFGKAFQLLRVCTACEESFSRGRFRDCVPIKHTDEKLSRCCENKSRLYTSGALIANASARARLCTYTHGERQRDHARREKLSLCIFVLILFFCSYIAHATGARKHAHTLTLDAMCVYVGRALNSGRKSVCV